jgi:hypothetical protein
MDDTSELERELTECNRHIVQGHARIARQREIIGHLTDAGQDVTDAENLLRSMMEGLEAMEDRRQQIMRELQLAEVRVRT